MPKKTRNKRKTAAQVVASTDKPAEKIIQLYAITMVNFRMPAGDRAWDAIREIAGVEYTTAMAFLTGFIMGEHGIPKSEMWEELIPRTK